MKKQKHSNDSVCCADYYTELLKNKRKLILFNENSNDALSFIGEILRANTNSKRPVILLTYIGTVAEWLIQQLGFNIIYLPGFKEISEVKGQDNSGKLFFFDIKDKNYQSTFELAMLLNQILIRQGEQPIVIINGFEKLFDGTVEENMAEYVKELIIDSVTDEQILALISTDTGVYSSIGKDIQDAFYDIGDYVNCILTSTGFLSDGVSINTSRMNAINSLVEQCSKNVNGKTRAISTLVNLEYNAEQQLYNGIVIDMDTGMVSGFVI